MAGRPEPIGPQQGLGKAVRRLREEAKLSPEDLAERAGLSGSRVSKIEAGEDDPLWGDMRRVAAALEVSMEQLAELAEGFEEEELL